MSVTFYVPKENGDLKRLEEVEGTDRADLALDALLDEIPKYASHGTFVAVVGDLEDGQVCTLTLEDDEPVQPRRRIAVSNAEDEAPAPKRGRGRPAKPKPAAEEVEEDEGDEEEEPPAPKRRGRPPGSKNKTTTRKPAARKPAPKKTPAKKPAGKKSPFTKSAKGDE